MPSGTRIVGGAAAATVVALPLVSFAVDWRLLAGALGGFGYALVGIGGVIALVNVYLSFIRPSRSLRGGWAEDAERHVSGIPILGMLVLPGLWLAPPSALVSALVLMFVVADTGNVVWLVGATWRDDGCWGGYFGSTPNSSLMSPTRLEAYEGSDLDEDRRTMEELLARAEHPTP